MTGIEHEPSPLLLLISIVLPILALWLFLEIVKFAFNPKRYLKQLTCRHWHINQSTNDKWRLYDYKLKCCECDKVVYCNLDNLPENSDFYL